MSTGIVTGVWHRIVSDYTSYYKKKDPDVLKTNDNSIETKQQQQEDNISNSNEEEREPLITKNHFINYVYFMLFFELLASVAFIVERIKGRKKKNEKS
jgi:hypothetical protein